MEKQRVLFLCTDNSVRSQMAEAFLRTYAGQYFETYSAGLEPKPVNPHFIHHMDEMGIDLSGQTSKGTMYILEKVYLNIWSLSTMMLKRIAHPPGRA